MSIPPDTRAVSQAVAYAAREHGDQRRKGTQIPYLSHLLAVTALTMEHGGTTEQCMAAALHDVVEDCGGAEQLEQVRAAFGDRVAGMVEALSDAAPAPGEAKAPWLERKQAYLRHLEGLIAEDHPAVLVAACDKLHNAEAIVADATDPEGDPGPAVFDRFTATAEQTAWYYRALREALAAADVPARLRRRFDTAVDQLVAVSSQGAFPFPLAGFLGLRLDMPEPGRATARLDAGERHHNPLGAVHGAVLFAMVDTAMGAAVLGVLPEDHRCATTDVHLRFVRAVTDGALQAEVEVTHQGKRTITLEGRVTNDGVLVATATAAFAVIPPR